CAHGVRHLCWQMFRYQAGDDVISPSVSDHDYSVPVSCSCSCQHHVIVIIFDVYFSTSFHRAQCILVLTTHFYHVFQ
ncbi:Unknown protein, partial [Striga hermonthica]